MLDLMRFITPVDTKPDPNGAIGNAISGMHGAAGIQLQKQQLAQQASQFDREQQRLNENDQWGQRKDIVSTLHDFANVLATNPKAAPYYEQELRAMGINFHPTEQPSASMLSALAKDSVSAPDGIPDPSAAHALTPDEYKADKLTPDAVNQAIGGAESAAPAPKPQPTNKAIPPLLGKFMALQSAEAPEESAEPTQSDQEESAERVRSIGGTPQAPSAPIDPNVGPPEEIAKALAQPMTPAEALATGNAAPVEPYRAPAIPDVVPPKPVAPVGGATHTSESSYSSSRTSGVTAHPVVAPTTPGGQAASAALAAQGIRPRMPAFRASWNGIDLGVFDPEAAADSLKRQAEETGQGYANTTVEKYRPLIQALAQAGHSPEEIHKMMAVFGTPEVLHLIGADAAIKASGAKSAGVRGQAETLSEYKDGRASVRELFNENPGLNDDVKSVKLLPKAIQMLRHPKNGMDASLAVREMMLAYNKGAFSDKDADAYMHDVSVWDKFKNLVARQEYSSIDQDMLEKIASAAEHKLELADSNVGSSYQALVDSNQYERDTPQFKRGRRLAAQQVFGGTKFYNNDDWADDPAPKETATEASAAEKPGAASAPVPATQRRSSVAGKPGFLQ